MSLEKNCKRSSLTTCISKRCKKISFRIERNPKNIKEFGPNNPVKPDCSEARATDSPNIINYTVIARSHTLPVFNMYCCRTIFPITFVGFVGVRPLQKLSGRLLPQQKTTRIAHLMENQYRLEQAAAVCHRR